jgi:hypothetical protein
LLGSAAVANLLVRCLGATLQALSDWSGSIWQAYAHWESRPFHNGDGI